MKMYNVVVKNIKKSGAPIVMNAYPLTHEQACANLMALTKYPWRLEYLEEISA